MESNTEPVGGKLFPAVQPVPEEQPGMPPECDDTGGGGGQTSGTKHMCYATKYGSILLTPMKTHVSNTERGRAKTLKVSALADLGASIWSFDLALKLKLKIKEKGDVTLRNARYKFMNVSGQGEVIGEEDYGHPYTIGVSVSKDLGHEEMVMGLEDLKSMKILHMDFPETLPEFQTEKSKTKERLNNFKNNSIRGDQCAEHMGLKDKRERASKVMLYLEERYKQVD